MHVTDQPPKVHVTHDVFHRGEGEARVRLVIHGQKNAGNDLHDQHEKGQGTEVVPEIKVLRGVVFCQMFSPDFCQRKTFIYPAHHLGNHDQPPFLLAPIRRRWSSR